MTTIFSTPFLICLAIIFIMVGGVFMYFNQKMSQQNHKINGMFDLVNTMAEEMNYIRSSSGAGITLQPFTCQTQQVLANLSGGFRQKENELIQVSDEEDDDEEDDDEEEDEDDEDDDDDEEDDDEEDDDEDCEDNNKNIKIINILSESIYGVEHNDVEIIDDENNNESDDDDNDDDDDEQDDDDLSNEDDEPVELIDLINHNVLDEKTFTKEQDPISISSNGDNYSIDLNLLKTINISNSSSNENIDYKKMSLTKLREIVVERNLTSDSSKMKKNELLKLLE